jgi:uncharacterized protein (TIGR03085 family)
MSAADVLRRERAALCDTFARLGPDAPTLCEGWTTADLAAHLVVRERDPRSLPGILLGGPFARYTAKLTERAKRRGYDALLARLRSGPPRLMVATSAAVNVNENWIHHEDARRANGEAPRPEDPEIAAILTRILRRFGRVQARTMHPFGLQVVVPGGAEFSVRKGAPRATITGPIGEVVLFLTGRRDAARVEVAGDDGAVARLRTAKFGF